TAAARPTIAQIRDLTKDSGELSTNLAFVLEHLDDRRNAVEKDKDSPGGEGYTGLEALLQYPFDQSQAINIFDQRGYLLKLNALINECSGYTDAEEAREEPERTQRCSQALGPNQPGITTGAVSQTTPDKPSRRRARAPGAPQHSPPERNAPQVTGTAPPPPRSLLPDPKDLLDKLLPELPDVPDLLPRSGARSPSSSSDESERNLLDYLLGP
ncbi:MAG: hypothetical protein KY433_12320, partial [Actinobacteria bacterium]|nr:hypothetical protein [Actinomycetota bacterium]